MRRRDDGAFFSLRSAGLKRNNRKGRWIGVITAEAEGQLRQQLPADTGIHSEPASVPRLVAETGRRP